jgi:hypothetical protein
MVGQDPRVSKVNPRNAFIYHHVLESVMKNTKVPIDATATSRFIVHGVIPDLALEDLQRKIEEFSNDLFVSFMCGNVEKDASNMPTLFVNYKKIVYGVVWSNGL